MSALFPRLPRKAWTIVILTGVSALGSGMITPFLVIYLRDARDFPIEQAGLMLSTVAVAGLVGAPVSGWLIDKLGARRVLMFALIVAAAASFGLIFVNVAWEGFVWAALFGLSLSAEWPAMLALMASVVPSEHRATLYSLHFTMLNAGIGLGAVVGGLLVKASDAGTFFIVFAIDAVTFLVFAAVLRVAVDADARPAEAGEGTAEGRGWRRVLQDGAFMRLLFLSIVLITVGYAQLSSSFPAFATKEGEISTRVLGAVFAANTIVIVGMQLVVLRWLSGKRRAAALAAVGVLWAAAWIVAIVGGGAGGGVIAAVLFIAAAVVFGVGETFMQASLPVLVNDLAPDDIRGRYNASYGLTWSIGNIGGPALGGFMLGAGLGTELFVLAAVVCVGAAMYTFRLARFIPARAQLFSS